jgi:hypothetical protein
MVSHPPISIHLRLFGAQYVRVWDHRERIVRHKPMKKLSYAIICSTALVLSCFAPKADQFSMLTIACVFALCCLMTNENPKP